MKTSIIALFFVFTVCISSAQDTSFFVNPITIDSTYIGGNQYLVFHPSSTPVNKLLLFIPGTNAPSGFYRPLLEHVSGLGYHVIAVTYDYSVSTGTFFDYEDNDAFTNFRQEVCYGTPVCPDIIVDTNNSIYSRSIELLNYLDTAHSAMKWGQYLTGANEPNWSKIAIGGHSQGAGHAYYLAQRNVVERVVAFSGPNDYSNYFNAPAPWLSEESVTPRRSYYAYLNLKDDFESQFTNVLAATQGSITDSVNVDVVASPFGNSRVLYSEEVPDPSQEQFSAHNFPAATTSSINDVAWTYLFTSSTSSITSIKDETVSAYTEIYPNPSEGIFNLQYEDYNDVELSVFNLLGVLVLEQQLQSVVTQIDLTSEASGIYNYQLIRKGSTIANGKLAIK